MLVDFLVSNHFYHVKLNSLHPAKSPLFTCFKVFLVAECNLFFYMSNRYDKMQFFYLKNINSVALFIIHVLYIFKLFSARALQL